MPDEREPTIEPVTADGQGGSFLSLLKRASPVPSNHGSQPPPGTTLLNGRFSIQRRIGEGGMGAVFEAHDEQRRSAVAIKTLSWLDPSSIYRIKNEFRSLADVSHPNLCRLHELFSDDGWFFSMELVNGERFDEWVRPNRILDEPRLRDALAQLADGVAAIHDAGKLHRDLKPSNVLVAEDGRVVVLDFGLAVDGNADNIGRTALDEGISGTPAYMAPEQASGAAATAASDLYAIGAMLFVALTGRPPFEGRVGEILAAKQRDAAPRVRTVFADAPQDLALLCDQLLERDQAQRPDASRLRAELGRLGRTSVAPAGLTNTTPERDHFFGRETELAQLNAAYEAMVTGQTVVMFVAGESGMGKSALVHCFLDHVRSQRRAVVLEGRCYERESVPFKALDSVVDNLSRYLHNLKREEAGDLMPRDVFALARLFPVLDRVGAVAQVPSKTIPDPQELQQRAFGALSELLGRIRDRRPLVLFVDDLQWTDRDSTVVIDYLLTQPAPTPFMLIVSHRSEGADADALLQQTRRSAGKNPQVNCHSLTVGKLPAPAAQLLAQRLLGESTPADAAGIAAEGGGSPFLIGELVRQARLEGAGSTQLTLRQAVMRHVHFLPARARSLLDVLAVAGRPLAAQIAVDAADATHEAVDALLFERLARTARGSSDGRVLECYHDKIRESVCEALAPAALRAVHLRLGEQLSARADVDPEHLALHFHGAGEHTRATVYYERAGDASAVALAFDHAARQYQQALALDDSDPTRARALRVKLGSMLASAGSSRDAAGVYRAACVGARPEQALDYMRTASHLLTTSGYLDEGRVLLGEVLAAIGLSLPRSRRRALAAALVSRVRLALRGLRLSDPVALAPSDDARLVAMWTVVQGSLGNDPFLMVDMAARYARSALDMGSPAHAARALSMEAYLVSFNGPGTHARTQPLIATAQSLADQLSAPELLGWLLEIRGCVFAHEGRFAEAKPVLTEALECFTSRGTAVPFELAGGRLYHMNASNHLGHFREIATTATGIVENSLRRGDLYQATGVTGFAVPAWLAHLGGDEAKLLFREAKGRYQPQSNFQWSDYLILVADLNIALYDGHPQDGVALAADQWSALEQSQLLRMRIASALMHYYRAGCAISTMQRTQATRRSLASMARSSAGILRKTRLPHALGWAAVIEAGLALAERRLEVVAQRLRSAAASFDSTQLSLYSAATRRRLGQLIGGDEGHALSIAGEAAMRVEGVVDIEATTEMLAPGCRTASI